MSRLAPLLTWLAFPVYVWQGLGVRRRTSRMLPAHGPVLHEHRGSDAGVSLLVLGDSSAASVGIEQFARTGLPRSSPSLISARTGRAVRWRAAGFNSATSGQIRDHVLPNLSADPWTHIVLSIGTNDTKNFHSRAALQEGVRRPALRAARQVAGGARGVVAGAGVHPRAGACRRCSARSSKSAPPR